MSSRFANPTFLRRLKGILQRCFQGVFYHCLENHLAKMSKNCLCEMSYIPLYEMSFRQPCKISSRFANPTSFRRLKASASSKNIFKTSLRCLFADWESLIKRFWQLNFLKAHSLRQFLAAESPLKMMKNAFYFMSKVSFVLKIFSFLS